MDLRHLHDLPHALIQRPLLHGDVLARVVDLLPSHYEQGPVRTTLLLCHPDGRLRQLARLARTDYEQDHATTADHFRSTFDGLVAHTLSVGLVVVERPGTADLTAVDRVFAQAVWEAASQTGFRVLALAVVTPGGLTMLPAGASVQEDPPVEAR